jgi:hypothetical protein
MVTIFINRVDLISYGKRLKYFMMWSQHLKTYNICVLSGKLTLAMLYCIIIYSTLVVLSLCHFKQSFLGLLFQFLFVLVHFNQFTLNF